MLQFNSAVLAAAGSFCGRYAPFQAVRLTPHAGGVLAAATDEGKALALAFDPAGRADESCDLLPSNELLRACAGIKSAERDVRIEESAALVTTYRKTASDEVRQYPIQRSLSPFPAIDSLLTVALDYWGAMPASSDTAGRYNSAYLEKAIKTSSFLNSSLVLSAFDGGPLRLQNNAGTLCILIMPQTAEAIPPVPDWIQSFAASAACHSTQSR